MPVRLNDSLDTTEMNASTLIVKKETLKFPNSVVVRKPVHLLDCGCS